MSQTEIRQNYLSNSNNNFSYCKLCVRAIPFIYSIPMPDGWSWSLLHRLSPITYLYLKAPSTDQSRKRNQSITNRHTYVRRYDVRESQQITSFRNNIFYNFYIIPAIIEKVITINHTIPYVYLFNGGFMISERNY